MTGAKKIMLDETGVIAGNSRQNAKPFLERRERTAPIKRELGRRLIDGFSLNLGWRRCDISDLLCDAIHALLNRRLHELAIIRFVVGAGRGSAHLAKNIADLAVESIGLTRHAIRCGAVSQ